ncbi:MAG TPA: hypothetical protein VFX30_02615, partial [bacterium]|nr:hypothetical protein [bacterium]
MLNHQKVLAAFREVLSAFGEGTDPALIRPRAVAIRAHQIYCEGLQSGEKRPALVTFRKYVGGKSANSEVVAMLQGALIRPATRARLDRNRLREVFQEAVRRLESRLLKGQARPVQIARRAYEIYVNESGDSASQPSHHTFERLIYGKAADP